MDEITQYIVQLPSEQRVKYELLWQAIQEKFPELTPHFSYQMPGLYWHNKPIIWFGAFKNHLGIYPKPAAITAYQDQLRANHYEYAKGTIRVKWTQPINDNLIGELIAYNQAQIEVK